MRVCMRVCERAGAHGGWVRLLVGMGGRLQLALADVGQHSCDELVGLADLVCVLPLQEVIVDLLPPQCFKIRR